MTSYIVYTDKDVQDAFMRVNRIIYGPTPRYPKRFSRAKRKRLRAKHVTARNLCTAGAHIISKDIIDLTIQNPDWLRKCYEGITNDYTNYQYKWDV